MNFSSKHCQNGYDVLEMKYNPADTSDLAKNLKTEIRHITKLDQGRYREHYLVGMLIIESAER